MKFSKILHDDSSDEKVEFQMNYLHILLCYNNVALHNAYANKDRSRTAKQDCYAKGRGMPLSNIAEVRVPVSEIPDLGFTQSVETVVTSAQITLSIFPLAVCYSSKRQHKYTELSAEVDGVASGVLGRFPYDVCPMLR